MMKLGSGFSYVNVIYVVIVSVVCCTWIHYEKSFSKGILGKGFNMISITAFFHSSTAEILLNTVPDFPDEDFLPTNHEKSPILLLYIKCFFT